MIRQILLTVLLLSLYSPKVIKRKDFFLKIDETLVLTERDFQIKDVKQVLQKKYKDSEAIEIKEYSDEQKVFRNLVEFNETQQQKVLVDQFFVYYNFYFDEIQIIREVTIPNNAKYSNLKDIVRKRYLEMKKRGVQSTTAAKSQLNRILKELFVETVYFKLIRWVFSPNLTLTNTMVERFDYSIGLNYRLNLELICFIEKFMDGYLNVFSSYHAESLKESDMTSMKNPVVFLSKPTIEKKKIIYNLYTANRDRNYQTVFNFKYLQFYVFFHYNYFKPTLLPENIEMTSLQNSLKEGLKLAFSRMGEDNSHKTVEEVMSEIKNHSKLIYIPFNLKEGHSDETSRDDHYFVFEYKTTQIIIRLLKDEYFLTEITGPNDISSIWRFIADINPKFECYLSPYNFLYPRLLKDSKRFLDYAANGSRVFFSCDRFTNNFSFFLWKKIGSQHAQNEGDIDEHDTISNTERILGKQIARNKKPAAKAKRKAPTGNGDMGLHSSDLSLKKKMIIISRKDDMKGNDLKNAKLYGIDDEYYQKLAEQSQAKPNSLFQATNTQGSSLFTPNSLFQTTNTQGKGLFAKDSKGGLFGNPSINETQNNTQNTITQNADSTPKIPSKIIQINPDKLISPNALNIHHDQLSSKSVIFDDQFSETRRPPTRSQSNKSDKTLPLNEEESFSNSLSNKQNPTNYPKVHLNSESVTIDSRGGLSQSLRSNQTSKTILKSSESLNHSKPLSEFSISIYSASMTTPRNMQSENLRKTEDFGQFLEPKVNGGKIKSNLNLLREMSKTRRSNFSNHSNLSSITVNNQESNITVPMKEFQHKKSLSDSEIRQLKTHFKESSSVDEIKIESLSDTQIINQIEPAILKVKPFKNEKISKFRKRLPDNNQRKQNASHESESTEQNKKIKKNLIISENQPSAKKFTRKTIFQNIDRDEDLDELAEQIRNTSSSSDTMLNNNNSLIMELKDLKNGHSVVKDVSNKPKILKSIKVRESSRKKNKILDMISEAPKIKLKKNNTVVDESIDGKN